MHISNQNRTVVIAVGFVLMASIFAAQADAQQYPEGMPSMPSQPTQISGKYTNSNYGVDIAIPDGWSGMEMTSGSSTIVTAMPGGMESAQTGTPSTMMTIVMMTKDTTKPPPTQPQNMPQDEKCGDPSITTKTVNGVNLLEGVVECTGTTSMKMKYDVAQTDKYYVNVSYIAMPSSNYDSNVSAFDTALGSLQVANAIEAPAIPESTGTVGAPAIPEFPIAFVGMITVLMMGFAIIMTRRLQLRI
jgi:hypothetical protein